MAGTGTVHREKMTTGDVAVNGLLYGILAGAGMAGYLVVVMALAGESPAALLSRFAASDMPPSPLAGALAHLAISGIYGMVFTLIWRAAKGSNRLVWRLIGGIGYAGLLFAFSELVLLPAVQSPILGIPALHWGIGHAIYGVVLGLMTRRS